MCVMCRVPVLAVAIVIVSGSGAWGALLCLVVIAIFLPFALTLGIARLFSLWPLAPHAGAPRLWEVRRSHPCALGSWADVCRYGLTGLLELGE